MHARVSEGASLVSKLQARAAELELANEVCRGELCASRSETEARVAAQQTRADEAEAQYCRRALSPSSSCSARFTVTRRD